MNEICEFQDDMENKIDRVLQIYLDAQRDMDHSVTSSDRILIRKKMKEDFELHEFHSMSEEDYMLELAGVPWWSRRGQ